jgi:hypothetical protein
MLLGRASIRAKFFVDAGKSYYSKENNKKILKKKVTKKK